MLYEVRATKPYDGPWRQRWFTSDDFDLTVWMTEQFRLVGFQLAYDKQGRESECVLEWHEDEGYSHYRVQGGSTLIQRGTPIMRRGGVWAGERVCKAFAASSACVDPPVRQFVQERLPPALGASTFLGYRQGPEERTLQ